MTRLLSKELQEAVRDALDEPVTIIDPATNEEYVLVRSAVYAKLQGLMDDGTKFALREMGRKAGWEDPSMDAYDRLDPRKQ
jgi:hypothetical protein